MSEQTRYALAESVCIEPLIGRWVAWPHLLSPALYSLHLANYQTKALESFLANPDIHEKSCRNPRLIGGAFVDIAPGDASRVQELLDWTRGELAPNIGFAIALAEYDRRLAESAKGESLEDRYAELPVPLQGFVELLYDYFHRPIVRCLEGLLYASTYYKPDIQSLRLFTLATDGARPYYMSTPRLPDQSSLEWRTGFADPRIDSLCKLDIDPKPAREIADLLDIGDESALLPLLRESKGHADPKWRGTGIRARYFGHACVLLETRDVSILVDPLVSARPEDGGVDRFSFDDLPENIDFALITHGHHDHFVVETLLRLRHRIRALVVPKCSNIFYGDMSLRLMAQRLGFKDVREVDCLDEIAFPGGKIVAAPFLGEHNDLPSAKSTYFVEAEERAVFFAADANCLDSRMYESVRALVGAVDTLFVGMECVGAPLSWVYGPILPIKPDHRRSQDRRSNGCNAASAIKLAQALHCRRAFVYAVGREPWVRHLLALNPRENDAYMTEIAAFIKGVDAQCGAVAEHLFGKAELYI